MFDPIRHDDNYSSTMRNLLLSSINSMGDCLSLFDDACMVVYTNEAAKNIFGLTIGDYCCKNFKESKEHSDNCNLFKTISKKEELKIIEDIPISLVKDWILYTPDNEKNVSQLTFQSLYTPLFDKYSGFWGCIKLSRNLTQKKLISEISKKDSEDIEKLEKYSKKNDEVQQQLIHSEKLLSLGKISAGISHEIYNSLSVLGPKIKMFGTYLDKILLLLDEYQKLHKFDSHDKIKEQLDKITRIEKTERGIEFYTTKLQKFIAPCTSELYSIEKIVEGLNEFSNLQKAEFRNVNINDELENTLILLEYEFSNNNIKVFKRYDPTLTNIPCYPADLNQVVINILTNSIESLKEKSSKIKEFEPIIKLTTKKENDSIILIFFDNGCGYLKEFVDKIFDPFFTTKSPTTNTGLGLSTVINIIEKKHNGNVDSNTEIGEFAEFIVRFPLSLKAPSL
jgi:signal transduction histidine kinase